MKSESPKTRSARKRRPQSRSEARRARREAQVRDETRAHRTALSPLGLGIAIVAGIAIFVGVALVTGFLSPPGSSSPSGPPASADVLVHSTAASITFYANDGWLADDDTGTVRSFDTSTGRFVGKTIHTGGRPISVTSGYGRLWAADISNSVVYVIDPANGKVSRTPIPVAQGPVSIAAGNGGVWVASLLSGTVSLIDPATKQVEASVALPDGAVRLTLGGGYVWVSGQTDTLVRIDPRPLGVTLRWKPVRVGQGPIGVAYGDGLAWVANAQSGTVSAVDPRTLRITEALRFSSGSASDPTTVAVSQDKVWVGVGQQSALYAFDARTADVLGQAVSLPGVARDLVVDPQGNLWATTANPGRVVRVVPK